VEKIVTNAYSTKYINACNTKGECDEEVSTADAVSSTPNGYAINNCSEKKVDSVKLSKTQIKEQQIEKLRCRMKEE
jgi:hypothetical protein